MNIVREKPCQRRHHRVDAPLNVTTADGRCLVAKNWSLGGMLLCGFQGNLPDVGGKLELNIELPFQGFGISFDVVAIVVRQTDDLDGVGVEYQELDERARDILSHFIDDLIRGKMATIGDTICRIDIPVTPISTQPDPNPRSEVPFRRWRAQTILMSGFYLLLGFGIFGYLALLVFSHMVRIEVETAVVSSRVANITMPIDGLLVPINFSESSSLKRNEPIARIVNPDIRAKISEMEIHVEKRRRDLKRAQGKLEIERKRLELYQQIKRGDLQIARSQVKANRAAIEAVNVEYKRIALMKKKGLVEQEDFLQIKRKRTEIIAKLRKSELELEQVITMEAVSDRRYFNKKEFIADLDLLTLNVEQANSDLSLALRKLELLEERRHEQVIRAPFNGKIINIEAASGTEVQRGRPILSIEETGKREVLAYLDQSEIVHVGLGDQVSVFLPALSRKYSGTVISIDRGILADRTNSSSNNWITGNQKRAVVTVSLETRFQSDRDVKGGVPAVVLFPKRSTSELLHSIHNRISQFLIGDALADEVS